MTDNDSRSDLTLDKADLEAGSADEAPPFDHPLGVALQDGKLPWVWANLDDTDSLILEALVDGFAAAYNRQCVTEVTGLIPGCWREHPRLLHELPVLYWGWWFAHHHPEATLSDAQSYYEEHLPRFQGRLGELLGSGATNCRKGKHSSGANNELREQLTGTERLLGNASDPGFHDRVTTAFPAV